MQMRQPVLLAVDADQEILAAQQHDLPRRFAPDYRTVTADTPEAALAELHPEDHRRDVRRLRRPEHAAA